MSPPRLATLAEARDFYRDWMKAAALPLWAGPGRSADSGLFLEALTPGGAPAGRPRRARVQSRQAFVFAEAARGGFGDGLLQIAETGFAAYRSRFRRPDGLFAVLIDDAGRTLDDTPYIYEQAFSLLAAASLHRARGLALDYASEGETLRRALESLRRAQGGFREFGDHPFQSNAHMHLLEAALAWDEQGISSEWTALADEIVALCLDRFIDPKGGFLREFFDAEWRPAAGDDGRWVEPGHQFEWAWLLERWGRARREPRAQAAARTLFARGLAGVDRRREVAVNVLWDDLSQRDASARLWPQTEYLKAAMILGEEAEALIAANGLARYLDTPARGAWRDKLRPDGTFVDEPAPASSFYHIWLAVSALLQIQ